MAEKTKHSYNAFISYYHQPDFVMAESLQKWLRKLGSKWFQLKFRAVQVFRDTTDSSGAGELKDKITRGIDQSEYLVILASKEGRENCKAAGRRDWVWEEVEYWLHTKYPEAVHKKKKIENAKLIICVTDGRIDWRGNDFDWNVTDCLPENLKGVLKGMPGWIDFRGLREKDKTTKGGLSLELPEYKQKVAEVSAQLQGTTVDSLIAKDRNFKFIGRLIVGILAGLLITLSLISVLSSIRANANEKRAVKEASKATALYLASESDKLMPAQGLRLLEQALAINPDDSSIWQKLVNLINTGPAHQFKQSMSFQSDLPHETVMDISGNNILTTNWVRESDVHNSYNAYNIHNLVTNKRYPILVPDQFVSDAEFSPGGKYIICSVDYKTALLEISDYKEPVPASLPGADPVLEKVSFSCDDSYLYTVSTTDTVKLYDLTAAKPARIFQDKKITHARFAVKGKYLWLKESSGTESVYDLSEGIKLMQTGNRFVLSEESIFQFSKKGVDAELTNLATKETILLPGIADSVIANIYYSPFKKYLVAAVKGKADMNDYLLFSSSKAELKSEDSIVFFRNDRCIIYKDEQFQQKIIDLATGKVPAFLSHLSEFDNPKLSVNGKYLMMSSSSIAYVYKVNDSLPQQTLVSDNSELTDFSFSQKGNFVYAVNSHGMYDGDTTRMDNTYWRVDDIYNKGKAFGFEASNFSASSDSLETFSVFNRRGMVEYYRLNKKDNPAFSGAAVSAKILNTGGDDYLVIKNESDTNAHVTLFGIYKLYTGSPVQYFEDEKGLKYSALSHSNYHIRQFDNDSSEIEDLVSGRVMAFPAGLVNEDNSYEFVPGDSQVMVNSWNQVDFRDYRASGDYNTDYPNLKLYYQLPSGELVKTDSSEATLYDWITGSPPCTTSTLRHLNARAEENIVTISRLSDKQIISKIWFDLPIHAIHFRARTGELLVELNNKSLLVVRAGTTGNHVFYTGKKMLNLKTGEALKWLSEFGNGFIPPLPKNVRDRYETFIKPVKNE